MSYTIYRQTDDDWIPIKTVNAKSYLKVMFEYVKSYRKCRSHMPSCIEFCNAEKFQSETRTKGWFNIVNDETGKSAEWYFKDKCDCPLRSQFDIYKHNVLQPERLREEIDICKNEGLETNHIKKMLDNWIYW